MQTIKLSNGVEMPLLGCGVYGSFQMPPIDCIKVLARAIDMGYRMFDTSLHFDSEEPVGCAWRESGLGRDEFFLVARLGAYNLGEAGTAEDIDESLRWLQTDHIDLLLMQYPYGDVFGAWRAMERAYREGKVRAVGVSNFTQARFFDLANLAEVKPMVNQLQCNVFSQQRGMEGLLREFGCRLMAWAPLGGHYDKAEVVENGVLASIGARHGMTAAQVALRWLTQRSVAAVPRTINAAHMAQNLGSAGFELDDSDMELIASMNQLDAGSIDYEDVDFVRSMADAARVGRVERNPGPAGFGFGGSAM
ncbi:MAG: aldo/keto reductase [Bacteroidales bacterium]|nr:aldo/keto reductase [Bacteroidales bacterium]